MKAMTERFDLATQIADIFNYEETNKIMHLDHYVVEALVGKDTPNISLRRIMNRVPTLSDIKLRFKDRWIIDCVWNTTTK